MKRSIGLLAAGALLLLSCMGCVSGDRALRNSPAGRKIEVRFDGSTVNLWPLYYHSGDFTSVLWPLFDLDSRGFAVRPLFHHDRDAAAILWPLSGWDHSGGWALTAYWGEGYCGMFPLFHSGKFHTVGPFFWEHDGEKFTYLGMFPLIYYWKPDNWFAGPVWRTHDSGGLFPVLWLSDDFNLAGPAWWDYDSGNFGLFPVQWKVDNFNMIGPAWWNCGSGNWGFFPLVWNINRFHATGPVWWNYGNQSWGVFPLVKISQDYRIIGPVWWRKKQPGGGFFPLFGLYANGTRQAGPVWWGSGEKSRKHGFFPLYWYESDADRTEFNLGLVLFMLNRSGQENLNWWAAGGLAGCEKYGGHLNWRFWPLVNYGRGGALPSPVLQITDDEHRDRPQALPDDRYTPFGKSFGDGREWRNVTLENRKTYIGTLLAFHETGTSRVWRPGADSATLDQLRCALDDMERNLIQLDNGRNFTEARKAELRESLQNGKKRIAECGEKLQIALSLPEKKEDFTAWRRLLAERFCTEVDFLEHRTLCGLTSWYEQFGDEYRGQFGMGAVIIRKYADKSDFRLLGFLCREKHDGDSSEYLYPPFISVKESPGRCRWSFLYRVFSYENNDGRKSGHIFFIPWGEK